MGTDTGTYPIRVPWCGFADDILEGKIKNAMIIAKSVPWKNDKPVRWSIFRDPWKYKGTGRSCSQVSEDEVKGLIAKAIRKEFFASL